MTPQHENYIDYWGYEWNVKYNKALKIYMVITQCKEQYKIKLSQLT